MTPDRLELKEVQKKVKLYLSVNRFDAAEKLLKATLAEYGPLANIHNLLGVTYHQQSRFPEALEEFYRALHCNPDFLESALNLTATLCDLSRYDAAREVFTKVLGKDKVSRKPHELILGRIANQHVANGKSYQDAGMNADAISEYRKALSLYDRMPDVKMSLAKLYIRVGQHDKAKNLFEEMAKETNCPADAHNWLGILYYKLGRQGEARRQFEKAGQLEPSNQASRAFLKISSDWDYDGPKA